MLATSRRTIVQPPCPSPYTAGSLEVLSLKIGKGCSPKGPREPGEGLSGLCAASLVDSCRPSNCQHLQDYITFALSPSGPRATYILQFVREWREAKLHLKRRTAHRKSLQKDLAARAFAWWAGCHTEAFMLTLVKDGILYEITAATVGCGDGKDQEGDPPGQGCLLKGPIAEVAKSTTDFLRRMKQHNSTGSVDRRLIGVPASTCPDHRWDAIKPPLHLLKPHALLGFCRKSAFETTSPSS
eukprot:s905_g13.t1